MPSVGVLILFAIAGALICARARVASGAVLFGALAVLMFVATPAGAGLPGAVSSFLSTFDHAASPVLNGHGGAG
jgi:hypothetical protein